jgi:hypothetical protein
LNTKAGLLRSPPVERAFVCFVPFVVVVEIVSVSQCLGGTWL